MNDQPRVSSALITRAKALADVRTNDELRALLKKGLGTTFKGQKILNAHDFSMRDIAQLRKQLHV